MKTKDEMQISVQTHPNGYSLTVNGESFMYFSPIDFVAGVLAHVGMCETSTMEKGTILSSLFSAMMGDAYADAVTTLKQRVGLLTSQYQATIDRMDDSIAYVTQAEKTIDSMLKRLDVIGAELKATESVHVKNNKVVEDMQTKLTAIEEKANKVMESLSNSATIMKAMEETKTLKEKKKDKADEGLDMADKSSLDDSKSDKADNDGKSKGKRASRKESDKKIMEIINKKAKENPNIK